MLSTATFSMDHMNTLGHLQILKLEIQNLEILKHILGLCMTSNKKLGLYMLFRTTSYT